MLKSTKPPAFQFYAKDWIGSKNVRMMNPTQRGYYIQLLAEAWDNTPIGHLPNNPSILMTLAGETNSETWEKNSGDVLKQFKVRGKKIYSPRLCVERKKQSAYSENRRKAGSTSARLIKQTKLGANKTSTDVPTEPQQDSTLQSSSSSSTSSSIQDLKPSARKARSKTDERFAPFVEVLHRYHTKFVGQTLKFELWFGNRGGRQLKGLLKAEPALDFQVFEKSVAVRARSPGVNHTQPVYEWISHVISGPKGYSNGHNGNGQGKSEQRQQRNDDKYARIEQRIAGVPEGAGVALAVGIGGSGNRDVAARPQLLSPNRNTGSG